MLKSFHLQMKHQMKHSSLPADYTIYERVINWCSFGRELLTCPALSLQCADASLPSRGRRRENAAKS